MTDLAIAPRATLDACQSTDAARTPYLRPALTGEVATRARDLMRDICAQHEVTIMKGHVAKDPVHMFVSIPPPGDHQPNVNQDEDFRVDG